MDRAQCAAATFALTKDKYSQDEQKKVKRAIRRLVAGNANIDMANVSQTHTAQGEVGKTRTQPRQYGGRFGVKGSSVVEQKVYGPKEVAEAIDNLRPGQSIKLPNNAGKVRRLSNGFQIVSPNGETNIVVRTPALAAAKANNMAKLTTKGKGVTK